MDQRKPYDSHPAPRERLELLEGIQGDPPRPSDHEPVSDLIPGLEGLQQEMTSLVQHNAGLRRAQVEKAKR
jgi:hypothetical protein